MNSSKVLHTFEINICASGSLGLRLSRAPWDPYPWVSSVQRHSSSYEAGLRVGDTVLKLNGCDVLGLKISEIAKLLQREDDHERTISNCRKVSSTNNNSHAGNVNLLLWRNKNSTTFNTVNGGYGQEDEINDAHNINQQSLQKFATCLQHIAQLLECPVCLEVIKPPGWQCCNGHVLCNSCRSRSVKCPVCRVPLGPRGRCLLSDKLFHLLAESFPCDGVRRSAHVSKCSRPCSTNQPRMGTTAPTAIDEQQTHLKSRNPSALSVNDIL